jgi:hypothetical protein
MLVSQAVQHRHLNHQSYSLAAIDDVISRGRRADWEALRDAARADVGLLKKILQVCRPKLVDPYAQRYHFWNHYANAGRTA